MKNKNKDLLESFTKYCEVHPEERFWQALRNWSGWPFIIAMKERFTVNQFDTFHWEENRKP
jgi:hypothetical protein